MVKITLFSLILILYSPLYAQFTNLEAKLAHARALADSSSFEDAVSLIHTVISALEQNKNDTLLAKAYIRLGSTLCQANKCNLGLGYYQKANKLSNLLRHEELTAYSHYGIAAAYQTITKYDDAVIYYLKSIPYFQKLADSTTLSYLYSNLGLLYTRVQDYSKSETYFKKAVSIQLSENNLLGLADSYYNLGISLSGQNRSSESLDYYKKGLDTYWELEGLDSRSKSLRAIALEYYNINDTDSSAYYFYLYDSIRHDVFHQEDADMVLELETKFKTAEFERDNARKQSRITTLYFTLGFILVLSSAGYLFLDQRRKRIKAEALINEESANQKIKNLLQDQEMKTAYALLEGQDKERKRIASELHDNLGSILVTLNMYADSLLTKSDKDEVTDIATRISKTSNQANEEVRKISHSLDSGLLKHFGLKTAINQLMEAIELSKKIKIELELQLEERFSNETGLEIYRIIQELVNNSLKHSNCTKIRLELNQIDKDVSLIYEDNGKGFDLNSVKKGMGLNNMEKRTEKLGGDFKVDSRPGHGSTFIIEIPLP